MNRLYELIYSNNNGTPDDYSDDVLVEKFAYEYFGNGNKSKEVAINKDGNSNEWSWDYDGLGRLINERHDNHNDSLDYLTNYVYDLVGNRLHKDTDKNGDGVVDESIRSIFDVNDRLLNETKVLDGIVTQTTEYSYNRTEQIGKKIIDSSSNQVIAETKMEYNLQGRLARIVIETYTNGVLSKVVEQEYDYDAHGIKIKQIMTTDGKPDETIITEYLNNQNNHTGYSQVLEEREYVQNVIVKSTTFTIGHSVLAQFTEATGFLALLTDGHRSTRAIANALGDILQEYNYDAYGNALGFTSADALTNLLYSGEQFNPVSGLQYLRARWYNPQNGQFNRLDPFSGDRNTPLSFHKYAYASMNPVMYSDPTGHIFKIIALIVFALGIWGTWGIFAPKVASKALKVDLSVRLSAFLRDNENQKHFSTPAVGAISKIQYGLAQKSAGIMTSIVGDFAEEAQGKAIDKMLIAVGLFIAKPINAGKTFDENATNLYDLAKNFKGINDLRPSELQNYCEDIAEVLYQSNTVGMNGPEGFRAALTIIGFNEAQVKEMLDLLEMYK